MTESDPAGGGILWRGLAGIQRGVLAGLAMLAWFSLASALLRQSLWVAPNLFGMLVDENAPFQQGFGRTALAGLALVVFVGGLVGALFALATSAVRSRRRLLLMGILVGVVGFYFSNAVVFRKLGAVAWVYSSPRSLLVAHLLFGIVLGSQPARPEASPPAPGAGGED